MINVRVRHRVWFMFMLVLRLQLFSGTFLRLILIRVKGRIIVRV